MTGLRIGPGCHTAVAIRPVVAGADRPVVAGADAGDVARSFCVALSFLARAEEFAPNNGRVKAAIGSALVMMERPADAFGLWLVKKRIDLDPVIVLIHHNPSSNPFQYSFLRRLHHSLFAQTKKKP